MQKLFMAVFFLAVSGIAWADLSEQRELTLDATGLGSLQADVGAGSLEIRGVPGATSVDVIAIIEIKGVSEEKARKILASDIKLTLERAGDSALLIAKSDSLHFLSRREILINLEVTTPENFNLDVDDGSGAVVIRNIGGNVRLDDGSGSIEMASIGGNVTVDDGSGSIDIENVGGDLALDDGSGTINLRGVAGQAEIDDGSGNMDIREINGSVFITDGSGSIMVTDVEGDLTVTESGSGSLSINGVKGRVQTDEK